MASFMSSVQNGELQEYPESLLLAVSGSEKKHQLELQEEQSGWAGGGGIGYAVY